MFSAQDHPPSSAARLTVLMLAGCGFAVVTFFSCRSNLGTFLPTRRHVLLITVDALRADYLSANGYDLPSSPVMDGLLRSGVHFTNAVTTTPRTTPAVASLLTGTYPQTNGVRRLTDRLSAQLAYLPALARARGYRTVAVLSNPLLTSQRGLARGFDSFDVADDAREASQTTAAALHELHAMQPSDAVFAWVHYIDPHVPYYPPPELADQFDPTYHGRYQRHFGETRDDMGEGAFPADLAKEDAIFRNSLPDEVNAHIRRLYAADIRNADNEIGELLTELRGTLGDDWVIVLASDHGESLGENNYYFEHGDYVSEGELRVPLAFVFPNGDPLQGSRTVPTWVSLVDVAPTLVELLDLHPTAEDQARFDGRSLMPALRGEPLAGRPLFAECGDAFFPALVRRRVAFGIDGRLRTVILNGQKLVWTPGRDPSDAFEVYDLTRDPHEVHNLFDPKRNDGAVSELRSLLDQWCVQGVRSSTRLQLTQADRERLRALGYTN